MSDRTRATSLSVVIADLDSPILGDVLEALLAQRRPDVRLEVLVAGRDAPGHARRFSDVDFLETAAPVPPARARNLALARATGDLVASLDADCVPEPGWLDALLAAHAGRPAGVAGGSLRIDAENAWAFADNLASFHEYLPSRSAGLRPYFPACNFSAPREVFRRVGPFDETLELSEDLDWMLRARRAGYALRFHPEVRAWHRSQRTTARDVISKAGRAGSFSILNRRRYADLLPAAPFLARRWALLLSSPVVALAVTSLAFARHPAAWRRPHVAPVVFAAKLAWCLGAARRLGQGE